MKVSFGRWWNVFIDHMSVYGIYNDRSVFGIYNDHRIETVKMVFEHILGMFLFSAHTPSTRTPAPSAKRLRDNLSYALGKAQFSGTHSPLHVAAGALILKPAKTNSRVSKNRSFCHFLSKICNIHCGFSGWKLVSEVDLCSSGSLKAPLSVRYACGLGRFLMRNGLTYRFSPSDLFALIVSMSDLFTLPVSMKTTEITMFGSVIRDLDTSSPDECDCRFLKLYKAWVGWPGFFGVFGYFCIKILVLTEISKQPTAIELLHCFCQC